MTDDRVSDVLRVCQEALGREGAARAAYLDTACGTDTELRRDVEAVLAEPSTGAHGFLDAPPWAAPTAPALVAGQRLGAYEVTGRLGAGGMGEVYKARDTRLGRTVAIKVLPAALAANEGRRRRLEREAKAIAALSHPNIVTLYSVERTDNLDFITMEFVDGRPLSDLIPKKGLPVADLLGLATQIADALGAAHERGIIHRDLKPSNVMVSRDSRAKVLDFGLARLMEAEPSTTATTRAPSASESSEGRIVGTVAYMSPEQAEGKPLDQRSDIFSLGILLYEMATGERPFKGDSNVSLLSSIVRDTPRFAADVNPSIPAELARIIRRCLQKDRERRYQTAKDIRIELADVKEELDAEDIIARELLERPPNRHPVPPRWPARRVLIAASGGVLLVVGGLLVAWLAGLPPFGAMARTGRRDAGTAALSPAASLWTTPSQLTSAPGWERDPAISGDGTLIGYASNESGNSDVWVIPAAGGNAVNVTHDPAIDEKPAWFADNSALAFASDRSGRWNIWQVQPLGGGASMLVPNASDPAISPDGRSIAFVRADDTGNPRVMVAPLDDLSRAHTLTEAADHASEAERDPAWSPDSRFVCYSAYRGLWVAAAAGRPARRLTTDSQWDIEPVWSPDGQTIYFSSLRGGTYALWQIPAAGGLPERVTHGAGPERHPTISRTGFRLAFSDLRVDSDLVLHDLASGAEQVTGTTRAEAGPAFSPDRRALVYVCHSKPGGGTELWLQPLVQDRFAGAPFRLAEQPGSVSQPRFSPDGRWIVYQRVVDGKNSICVIPAGGGAPEMLVGGAADAVQPAWSPAGDGVAFAWERDTTLHIWVVPVADGRPSGPPRQLTFDRGDQYSPAWSPAGRRIAYVATSSGAPEVWVTQSDGKGGSRKVSSGAGAAWVRWHPRGAGIIVSGSWGGRMLSLRLLDPDSLTVTALRPPVIQGVVEAAESFDVSPDGRFVAFSRGNRAGDIWVMNLRR